MLSDDSIWYTQTYRARTRPVGVYAGTVPVHQIPKVRVRARAAARGPARFIQPGHIEFGTVPGVGYIV
eukprot:COSAG02_NODE_5469_length_4297_cov_2.425202_3_plen_68_part_00